MHDSQRINKDSTKHRANKTCYQLHLSVLHPYQISIYLIDSCGTVCDG